MIHIFRDLISSTLFHLLILNGSTWFPQLTKPTLSFTDRLKNSHNPKLGHKSHHSCSLSVGSTYGMHLHFCFISQESPYVGAALLSSSSKNMIVSSSSMTWELARNAGGLNQSGCSAGHLCFNKSSRGSEGTQKMENHDCQRGQQSPTITTLPTMRKANMTWKAYDSNLQSCSSLIPLLQIYIILTRQEQRR